MKKKETFLTTCSVKMLISKNLWNAFMCLVGHYPLDVVITLCEDQLWIIFQVTAKKLLISTISSRCSSTNPRRFRYVQKGWIQSEKTHKQQRIPNELRRGGTKGKFFTGSLQLKEHWRFSGMLRII